MTAIPPKKVPRATHGLVMLGATLLAFGMAYAIATGLGGNGVTIRTAMIALALGSIATFAPLILSIDKDHWGLAVAFTGAARMLIVLGYCYAVRETTPDIVARPLFLAAVSGVMLLLLSEAASSIKVLSVLERQRVEERAATDAPSRKTA